MLVANIVTKKKLIKIGDSKALILPATQAENLKMEKEYFFKILVYDPAVPELFTNMHEEKRLQSFECILCNHQFDSDLEFHELYCSACGNEDPYAIELKGGN